MRVMCYYDYRDAAAALEKGAKPVQKPVDVYPVQLA